MLVALGAAPGASPIIGKPSLPHPHTAHQQRGAHDREWSQTWPWSTHLAPDTRPQEGFSSPLVAWVSCRRGGRKCPQPAAGAAALSPTVNVAIFCAGSTPSRDSWGSSSQAGRRRHRHMTARPRSGCRAGPPACRQLAHGWQQRRPRPPGTPHLAGGACAWKPHPLVPTVVSAAEHHEKLLPGGAKGRRGPRAPPPPRPPQEGPDLTALGALRNEAPEDSR